MKSVNGNFPLISVIVPVYKVELYLARCVESIVNQTYRNLEIILVDDGSPDKCPQMCDVWAEKDSRIKVIHKENGGLSDARNVGMAAATGELIGFVDSDDWIEAQMYECLYDAIVTTNSDIASCGARRFWLDERPGCEMLSVNKDNVFEHENVMNALITANGVVQTVWNKLYCRKLLDGVVFPLGIVHEDEFWTWKILSRATRLVTVKESYYHYLQRDDSIMGTSFSEKSFLVIEAKTERQDYLEKFMPNLAYTGRIDLIYTIMHLGVQVFNSMSPRDTKRCMKQLKQAIKNYPVSYKNMQKLHPRQKLHLCMIQSFFTPVCWLHSIRK